jgi:hypothetical protein
MADHHVIDVPRAQPYGWNLSLVDWLHPNFGLAPMAEAKFDITSTSLSPHFSILEFYQVLNGVRLPWLAGLKPESLGQLRRVC